MGSVIKATAALDRIEEDVRTSEQRARERPGPIADAAAARLAPALTVMDSANAILGGAQTAEAAGWTVVSARDGEADIVIGSTRDEMWNALGRVRGHAAMTHTYPGGTGTYTAGDPTNQPVLMQVLQTRIPTAEAPQWTAEMRQGWVAAIEAARTPLAAAVTAYLPLAAALTVAEAGRRAAVRSAHSKLVAFKRDLKNLGLTETQIHEIIPDSGDGDDDDKQKGGGGGGGPTGA